MKIKIENTNEQKALALVDKTFKGSLEDLRQNKIRTIRLALERLSMGDNLDVMYESLDEVAEIDGDADKTSFYEIEKLNLKEAQEIYNEHGMVEIK